VKDTRIVNMIEALAAASEDRRVEDLICDAQEIFAELSDDTSGPTVDPADLISLRRAQRFISAALGSLTTARQLIDLARNALADAYCEPAEAYSETVCGDFNTVGSMCTKPAGHDGGHRSQWGAKWTDESNAIAGQWMSKQMTGRD